MIACALISVEDIVVGELRNYSKIVKYNDSSNYIKAMSEKMDSLMRNQPRLLFQIQGIGH